MLYRINGINDDGIELAGYGSALIMSEYARCYNARSNAVGNNIFDMYPYQYIGGLYSLAIGRRWNYPQVAYRSKLDWYVAMKKLEKQIGIKMETIEFNCTECDEVVDEEEIVNVNGEPYCPSCCSQCEHCEEMTPNSDEVSDGYYRVCQDCYGDSYFTCESCDRISHSDGLCTVYNDTFMCESCISNGDYVYSEADGTYHESQCDCDECGSSSSVIHNYSYEPDTIFYDERGGYHRPKRGEFYFGAEIEMNTKRDWSTVHNAAQYVHDTIGESLVYLKEDCSIGTGFEFVTHPMNLDYWRNNFPWEEYERLASMGMLAWDSVDRRCGLHVNISRSAFTNSSHLAKFLLFVYRNEDELVKFAGRRSVDYAQFSSSERSLFIDHGKGSTSGSRHVAVNCQNRERIEFRIFRPSLKRDTVVASIELCHALCHFTSVMTPRDIYDGRFTFAGFREWLTAGDTPTTYETLVARIDKRVYGINPDYTITELA